MKFVFEWWGFGWYDVWNCFCEEIWWMGWVLREILHIMPTIIII